MIQTIGELEEALKIANNPDIPIRSVMIRLALDTGGFQWLALSQVHQHDGGIVIDAVVWEGEAEPIGNLVPVERTGPASLAEGNAQAAAQFYRQLNKEMPQMSKDDLVAMTIAWIGICRDLGPDT